LEAIALGMSTSIDEFITFTEGTLNTFSKL